MGIDINKFLNPTQTTKAKIDLGKFGITPNKSTPVVTLPPPDMSAFNYENVNKDISKVAKVTPAPSTPPMAATTPEVASIPKIKQAQQTASDITGTMTDAYHDFTDKLGKSVDAYNNYDISKEGTFTENLNKHAQTALSGLGVLFSPISAAAKGAAEIPGAVGSTAKLVNKAFEFGGNVASSIGDKVFDSLPIDQQSKNNLKPAVHDLGNLIGQIIVGHGVGVLGGKIMPKEAVNDIHTDFVNNVSDLVQQHDGTISAVKAKEIATTAAKKTVDNLKQAGQKELLPSTKTTDQVEPAEIDVNKFLPQEEANIKNIEQPNSAKEQLVAGTEFQPKISGDIERSFKEQGLLPQNWESLPKAERMTFEDQAAKTAQLINEDPVRATAILKGEEPLPSDMRSGFFLQGMKELVEKNADPELAHALANTNLLAETSVHAQEVASYRALQPDSIINQFAEIQKSREANIEKTTNQKIAKAKAEVQKEIVTEVKKTAPKIKDWSEFIDSISCK